MRDEGSSVMSMECIRMIGIRGTSLRRNAHHKKKSTPETFSGAGVGFVSIHSVPVGSPDRFSGREREEAGLRAIGKLWLVALPHHRRPTTVSSCLEQVVLGNIHES